MRHPSATTTSAGSPDPGTDSAYLRAYSGRLVSTLRWHQFEALWQVLWKQAGAGWYLYAVGEAPPDAPADADRVTRFLTEMDELLRREHDEDYCGIVYADDLESPSLVKIYDPGNLGAVCGFSETPPLPGWTLSLAAPVDLGTAFPPPAGRRRWWLRLFGP